MVDYAEGVRRCWPLFLEAIRSGRTITYGELAGRAGPPFTRRQIHRQLLTPLSARCRRAGLPDLAALVVRKDSGMPGAGWFVPDGTLADPRSRWAEALAECLAHRWPRKPDPRLIAP
jgi:hypothetical protein